MENTLQPSTPTPISVSPGQQLRLAREAKGWSPANIARPLNLSEQQVLDLESDNYQPFPALVYIQGYLRLYARLVGLSEQDILQALESNDFVPEKKLKSVEPHLEYEHYRPAFNPRRWLPWLNVLIAAGLITLVVLWLSEKNNSKTVNAPASAALSNASLTTTVQPPATSAATTAAANPSDSTSSEDQAN